MTYYEELGLDPSASTEEIHKAYRSLSKLLHPDQQSDPELRMLAERQMARLNRVYEILCDPDLRAGYDAPGNSAPAAARIDWARYAARVAWVAGAATGVV
ncbi:MAG: J domain-containing protein, partial [Bryobacteraceae bacterium]